MDVEVVAVVVSDVVLGRVVSLPDECVVAPSWVVDSTVGLHWVMTNVVITSG